MTSLQNLIPDPTTKNLWQCRPAAMLLVDLALNGFAGAAFISCMKVIGTRVYGMVSTTRNANQDEPFVYNIPTAAFIVVSGVTAANTPVSPATSGAWAPPIMDLIGSKLILTHPGYTGAGGAYFGVMDISNPAAPAWSATNTATNALAAPPSWVTNFNGRAFYIVNIPNGQPGLYMSDQLNPTTITNANQILTFGDNVPLTSLVGLPLENQLGGIIQSLIVFKGVTNLYQVTGDFSLSNLAINALNVATGTQSPLSAVSTPKGVMFLAPDGLRIIDFSAKVSDPIGIDGDGIVVPFLMPTVPSRVCAAYNSGVYKVQAVSSNVPGTPQQWWYDMVRGIFSGPHSQQASLMAPYTQTFIATLVGAGAKLFQSDSIQSSASSFTENGAALQWQWSTPMLPDTDQMAQVAMVETTLHMAIVAGNTTTVIWQDQNGTVIDTVTVVPAGSTTLWGTFLWGQALWQGVANALYPRRLQWHFPIVFRRGGLSASGLSVAGIKIGRLHLRYQILGYLQQGG